MSQKKVDQYKARKNGHSKEQKKEKFYDWLERIVGVVVCVALVAWIGYSVYDKIEQKQDSVVTQTTMDTICSGQLCSRTFSRNNRISK